MVATIRFDDTSPSGKFIVELENEEICGVLATLDPGECDVTLDLRRAAKINSADLTALIGFCVKMRLQQKNVVLDNVPAAIQEIFDLTRFSRIADIRPAPQAVKSAPRAGL
jgi:anti-anti-sigma regulatory factor